MFKDEKPPSQKLQLGHKNNDKLLFFRIKVTKLVCCLPIAYSMQKHVIHFHFQEYRHFTKWLKDGQKCKMPLKDFTYTACAKIHARNVF